MPIHPSRKSLPGLSVILPAFDEEQNIKEAVIGARDYLKKLGRPWEIIVVNDGSSDKTGEITDKLAKSIRELRVIHHSQNQGDGTALMNGFKAGSQDYLFFTDSDRQFHLDPLDIMLPLIDTGVVGAVIGYRLKRSDKLIRRILSWGYNSIVNFIFDLNVKDIDCAFKIFDRRVLKRIKIESTHFFVNTEILAKMRRNNVNILEVGVPHFPREKGKSTVSIKYIPLTIKELVRIRKCLNIKNDKK